MLSKRILGSSLIATLAFTAPAFAQSQIDNNQPVQGSLHSREVDLQNKLNASYAAGMISSTELAEMQRDLDGILVKEERQRTKAGGITDSNFDSISKALDCFEGKIVGHNRKVAATSTSNSVIIPAGVPVTPITGNQSSIVQPPSPTVMVPATTLVPTTTTTEIVTPAPAAVTKTTTVRTEVTP
ncbi:MAG: hypothetical protein JST89_08870 [Cyanobacteria bacterium SZAS-4]|nr:hypothetical protein [Cyanobacteria bacterium SZAS-4]